MELENIKIKLSPVLREYGVKKASVFGSVARNEAGPESDIDIMVELGQPMGLFVYNQFLQKMQSVLNCKVDLITNKSVNKFMAPYIIPELKTIYEG